MNTLTPFHLLLHALNSTETIGAKTLRRIISVFHSDEKLRSLTVSDLESIGIPSRKAEIILSAIKNANLEQLTTSLQNENIALLSCQDKEYPQLLKEIPDFPPLLYIQGSIEALNTPSIAIVGTRKPSNYGKQVTQHLATDLSRAGYTIVSGLAYGLDGIAHEATLQSKGKTIAVLGNGLTQKNISPRSHISLAKSITQSQGTVLSEYPPDIPASAGTFPARNRIIAGMTLGTIVIEAAEKSGTLITARCALDYNREVFAVPGSIYSPLSAGSHSLLKHGAVVVTNASDVIEALPLSEQESNNSQEAQKRDQENLSPQEQKILSLLSQEQLPVEILIRQSGFSAQEIASNLTTLEINGFIKDIGNKTYIRI